jgi:hypothetical protein
MTARLATWGCRRRRLLPAAVGLATKGGRPCCKAVVALLRAAEGVAASVDRPCYKWWPRLATRNSGRCCKQWRWSLPAGRAVATSSSRCRYKRLPTLLQRVSAFAEGGWPSPEVLQAAAVLLRAAAAMVQRAAAVSYSLVTAQGARCSEKMTGFFFLFLQAI